MAVSPMPVSRYSSFEYVTQGAYGVILKCRDSSTNEDVIIKSIQIFHSNDAQDWDNAIRIIREVHFLMDLHHPYIYKLLDVFPSNSLIYDELTGNVNLPNGNTYDGNFQFNYVNLVLPYFNQKSLDEYSVTSLKEGAEILYKILVALKYLHQNKVLFRDIKRENIFIHTKGQKTTCCLGDFGLSRSSKRKMTHDVQTRPYKAPCLILQSTSYGPEQDIYALGVVLFEMFSCEEKEALIPDELLGGARQLAVQMALVYPRSFSDLEELAEKVKCDLNAVQKKSVSFAWFAANRWEALSRNLTEIFKAKEAISSLTDLIQGMMAFSPKDSITIEDALNHEFFKVAGVDKSLADVYGAAIEEEDYETEVISAGETNEEKAAMVRQKIWDLIRLLPENQRNLPELVIHTNPAPPQSVIDDYVMEISGSEQKRRKS
jgi:serine/threonine protein kinase